MSNHLGEYIKARREQLGLRRSEVARRLGYMNLSRGSRRLCNLEDGGWAGKDFLRRLIEVLQIEPQVVRELIARDRQEYVDAWNRWADEPIPVQAVVRVLPGFMAGIKLPDGVELNLHKGEDPVIAAIAIPRGAKADEAAAADAAAAPADKK